MITVNHILWSNTFFFSTNGDGYSVFIGASNEKYIFFFHYLDKHSFQLYNLFFDYYFIDKCREFISAVNVQFAVDIFCVVIDGMN